MAIDAHTIPRAEATHAVMDQAIANALATHRISKDVASLDIRLNDGVRGDHVDKIMIGCALHPDAGARTPFEIVTPATDAAWAQTCTRHIEALVAEIARLERRRDTFDPDRNGRTAPRWAWDIHPTAASVLSLYARIPELDGSRRIDGEHGRVVKLQDAPGVESATIAYGDGVVRLVSARFPGGSTLTTENGWATLRVEATFPDVITTSLQRKPAGVMGEQLRHGPKATLGRITRVRQTAGSLELTLNDVLIPWDQRRQGGEDWRRTRMRFGKQPGGRHG